MSSSPHSPSHPRKGSIQAALGCLSRQTERVLNLLMVLALVAMIALVFTNVVLRYGFNSGISVSVELSRFLFVWVTFIGTVVGLMRHEHLSVTTFSDRLPAPVQALLGRLVTLVMLGCCLMLVKGSYAQTLLNWNNLSPISGVPVGVFYLAGLIAGVLMSILLVFRLLAPRHLLRQPRSQELAQESSQDRAQEVSS
ncbi:TRAP transporter small permease [Halomonas cupida]|uniref:TRAP transporter small permease n=1 Tax=Halomonas cupida TaxID=44933 RepID=UPI003A92BBC4